MPDFASHAIAAARVATGVLGWTPGQFWSATPVELATALEGRFGEAGAAKPVLARELETLREKLGDG